MFIILGLLLSFIIGFTLIITGINPYVNVKEQIGSIIQTIIGLIMIIFPIIMLLHFIGFFLKGYLLIILSDSNSN